VEIQSFILCSAIGASGSDSMVNGHTADEDGNPFVYAYNIEATDKSE
jgi:hypothetical protein